MTSVVTRGLNFAPLQAAASTAVAFSSVIGNLVRSRAQRQEAPWLFMLGSVKFSLDSIVPGTVERSQDWDWVEIKRLGARPALHYMGEGLETMTLSGVAYTALCGNNAEFTIQDLRKYASEGKPLSLLDADGTLYGLWVIVSLRQENSELFKSSLPKKISFQLGLKFYGE